MKIELEKVFERDIDLLMINKFINDKNLILFIILPSVLHKASLNFEKRK